jgi:hypothetical protein
MEKRVRVVSLRLTKTEYGRLEKNWKNSDCQKLSDLMRRLILGRSIIRTVRNKSQDDLMTELILLRKELNTIGMNFNQAVHRLHTLDQASQIQDWVARFESSKGVFFDRLNTIVVQVEKIGEAWLR